jgi:hydrophobic/amphiphilic exporter-1 (mainly G- bacteria), HAE1 family
LAPIWILLHLDVREKVDLVKGFLPEGASEPMVLQIDINAQAIIQMSLSGADVATLQQYAEDVVKPAIERVEGVASVSISGGYQNYVSIALDTEKLNGYGLSIDQLVGILASENINLPAGSVNKGESALLIRTVGEFETLEDIKNTLITSPTGGILRLSDIAEVAISKKSVTSITTVDGVPSVSIAVQKQSGVNTVMVASQVNDAIKTLDEMSPYDIKVIIDQSNFINKAIQQVAGNGIVGGLLAILILFIFLRSIRSTIIIGISIPISVIATGVILYFSDITLNMMTLGGLALGIGMLVDNSVVVLENIYRMVQEGKNKVDAAIEGTKEVAMAITASTLTTVAVFLPMVFVEGITAIMFREFSLTVTFSLMSSLIVSLTLIPVLASKLLVVDEYQGKHHQNKFKLFGWLLDLSDKLYFGLETRYRRLLKWSLYHKKTVVLIAIITLILSGLSYTMIGTEFIPEADEGNFSINVTLENGTKVEETNQAMETIVELIQNIPEIDYVFTTTDGNGFLTSSSNRGTISGVLISLDQRELSVFEVIKEIEERIKDIPGVITQVASQSSMGMMTWWKCHFN